jgi:hypothetical protein
MIHCLHSEYLFTVNEIISMTNPEWQTTKKEKKWKMPFDVQIFACPDDDRFVHDLASHYLHHLHA